MQTLYIINPESKYNGAIENTATRNEAGEIRPHYTSESWEEYNARKGGKLVILEEDQFDLYYEHHIESMVTGYKPISAERWEDALECLPPQRWHKIDRDISIFFILEAQTATLHDAYICDTRKGKDETRYFTALKHITDPTEKLLSDYLTDVPA